MTEQAEHPMEIHEASLMLTECDSEAQRSSSRTFEFDLSGTKQFGPILMESDWWWV